MQCRLGLAVALMAIAVACTATPPTVPDVPAATRTPAPTTPPSCKTSDGREVVDTMQQYARAWDDAVAVAGSTPRIGLAQPIAELQRIRREVQQQQWPVCARRAQQLLVEAMSAYIDGMVGFMGQRSGYEVDLARGGDILYQYRSEVASMTGGPTPIPRPTENATAVAVTLTAITAPVSTAIANVPPPLVLPTLNPTLAAALGTPITARPVGPSLRVKGTGANGLIVRRTPGGDRIASVNEGALVGDLMDRQEVAGREWHKIRATDGTEGWAASEFLVAP